MRALLLALGLLGAVGCVLGEPLELNVLSCPLSKPQLRVTPYGDTVVRLSLRRRVLGKRCDERPPAFASPLVVPRPESDGNTTRFFRSNNENTIQMWSTLTATRVRIVTQAVGTISGWGGNLDYNDDDDDDADHKSETLSLWMQAHVGNTHFATPALFMSAGLFVMVVAEHAYKGEGSTYPVKWRQLNDHIVDWEVGTAGGADVYVADALTSANFVRLLWGVSGEPALPPLFAHGFMLSRWGWKDAADVSAVLDEMDARGLGVDAFIMDFEWYLNGTGDYNLPATGVTGFPDFALANTHTMPNPQQQHEYAVRNVRMGGIRKPRLGDSALVADARAKGWILSPRKRDLDFSREDVRAWYATQLAALKRDATAGLPDFWWNDEGETAYFTYHFWIAAERLVPAAARRRFSINRSFTPGMQALEAAAVWSGDVPSTWRALRRHVAVMLDWAEAGVPWFSMDIGGFYGPADPSPELLVRWMQLGVFAGVMRVHSSLDRTPHWPFPSLWGADAANAMRVALQLRYSLLPMLYAAAWAARERGEPWLQRPAGCRACLLVAHGQLLIAPIVVEGARNRTVTLPTDASCWFDVVHGGPCAQGLVIADAPLQWMPMFARAGAVLLLGDLTALRASEAVGARARLYVRVFLGGAGDAELVEDDGDATDGGGVRRTRFSWSDALGVLRWSTQGTAQAFGAWYDRATIVFHYRDGHASTADIQIHDGAAGELRLVDAVAPRVLAGPMPPFA